MSEFAKTFELLTKNGFAPSNVLDIGAHYGMWSMHCKKFFPNASYTLIEPIHYPQLEIVCKKHGFTYHNALVFDTETQVEWYEMRNTGDSIFKETTRHFTSCAPVMRSTTTLDKMFPKKRFDLVKIDCQGAEMPIIRGGKELIQHVEVLILEIPFCGQWNRGVPDFFSHIKFLYEMGFEVYDIADLRRVADSILIQIDIVMVKRGSPLLRKAQDFIERQGPVDNGASQPSSNRTTDQYTVI